MAERQMEKDISRIRADHIGRYRFAAQHVKGDVLDAACGCGYGSWLLAERGAHVRGVDLSAEAIEFDGRHYAHERATYTRTDAAHVAGRYDWIVCFETLEHVEEDGALLRHFAALAPKLMVSVPNEALMPFNSRRFPFHVRHYTQEELHALLRGAGWTVKEWYSQPERYSSKVERGAHGVTLIALAER